MFVFHSAVDMVNRDCDTNIIKERNIVMTDKEIIKALECCVEVQGCSKCPRSPICDGVEHIQNALDLINRQKAEIERLEKGELRKAMTFNSDTIKRCVDEALKEFAEEFEKRCIESGIYPALIKNILKNLVKELAHETTETCDLKNKCGSCAYAIPTTFGKSKAWVECTNREHNERYCKREISCKRARTQPACKSYKELTEESNG